MICQREQHKLISAEEPQPVPVAAHHHQRKLRAPAVMKRGPKALITLRAPHCFLQIDVFSSYERKTRVQCLATIFILSIIAITLTV